MFFVFFAVKDLFLPVSRILDWGWRMVERAQVEKLVRQALQAQLAQTTRPVIDAAAVNALPVGATLRVAADTLITPLARDAALARNVTLVVEGSSAATAPQPATGKGGEDPKRTVAIGADHGGFALKQELAEHLRQAGFRVLDVGTHSKDAVDYPDFAYAVARHVADGSAATGIVVDGAGIGSAMAANKVPGIRAALCYDLATASNAREHNYANVLTLGAGLIGPNLARQIVDKFLSTPWGAERHGRRVAKITAIEQRYSK